MSTDRFNDRNHAVGVYGDVLDPPVSVCDVTYWLNYLTENHDRFRQSETKYAAINTAGKLEPELYNTTNCGILMTYYLLIS